MNSYKINNDGGVRSQESGGKKEEGRGRTGEEGKSFFITNYPDMI
ncbi:MULTISPECIES: hypothetical protein [Okeania]|nr:MULTISPECIES: hypothetical protein [Okeania]